MIYNPHNYFVIRTSERTPLPSLSWNQTFNMYIYMLLLCFLSQIHPHTAVKHTSSVPRTETEALDQQAQRYDTTTEPAAWSCSHSPRVSVLPTRSLSSHTGWPLSLSMRHHPSSSHWETSTHTEREKEGGRDSAAFCTYSGWLSMILVFFRGWKLGPAACTIPYPHSVVFDGSKFRRESRRSSVQRRRDGLTTAPLKQPVP